MNIKIINIGDKKEKLGIELSRGFPLKEAFYSTILGLLVGNIKSALTYSSREGMKKELVKLPKLKKKQLEEILKLPKKKIENYNNLLNTLLTERLVSDKELATELNKYYCKEKNYFAVMFISEDENNRPFEDMERYCKILNRLMANDLFVMMIRKVVREQHRTPIALKTVNTFAGNCTVKKRYNSAAKAAKPKEVVSPSKRPVKSFKKDSAAIPAKKK